MCFSPEKHLKCKANFESSSPVKISKFLIKMTDEDEIHINKRTKLEDPADQEILFDIKKQPKFQNVDGLLIWETN